MLTAGGGEKETFLNIPEHPVLNKAYPQEKLFQWSMSYWISSETNWPGGKEKPNTSPLFPPKEEMGALRSTCEAHSPEGNLY